MASIQGKVAIVTGSARGIGAGIAARFGKEGAKVICLDRNPAAETVNHIKSNGGDAMAIQCDISKPLFGRSWILMAPLIFLSTPQVCPRWHLSQMLLRQTGIT